jgi:coenzyme F420-0:L-glutamate ligase/coenzyme F420-1:gamma-L-glutamate ligase
LITETHHGFVCANAGIDRSNIEQGKAVLLPVDSDLSARKIREQIKAKTGLEIGIIISDTFGRTWRRGVVDIALGCAGIGAILDLRGTTDNFGNILRATEIALADEIASAADLAKPKSKQTPVAIVRGIDPNYFRTSSISEEVIRPPSEDLFR